MKRRRLAPGNRHVQLCAPCPFTRMRAHRDPCQEVLMPTFRSAAERFSSESRRNMHCDGSTRGADDRVRERASLPDWVAFDRVSQDWTRSLWCWLRSDTRQAHKKDRRSIVALKMPVRPRVQFKSKLFRVPGKGGWVFAPIPGRHAPATTHAWGRTPVRATVDGLSWNTSVWRGKDGRTLLAIPKKIRCGKDGTGAVLQS